MIIIETCPKCGGDLRDMIICVNPPIEKKHCPNCGWNWEGDRGQIVRIPFVEEIKAPSLDDIPLACQGCSNHPNNGGTGICHCVLGQMTITY